MDFLEYISTNTLNRVNIPRIVYVTRRHSSVSMQIAYIRYQCGASYWSKERGNEMIKRFEYRCVDKGNAIK